MGNSLQDQLLKAGAASKQQAQKAGGARRKKQKQSNKNAAVSVEESAVLAEQAQAEKIGRDRELNQKKQQEVERKAIAAQIRQLIEMNRLSRDDGETPYNFVDEKNVRKIFVSEELHAQLGAGILSIVKLGDSYEVVPTIVANKISERDPAVVIARSASDSDTGNAEDDPYANYQVPDDLIW